MKCETNFYDDFKYSDSLVFFGDKRLPSPPTHLNHHHFDLSLYYAELFPHCYIKLVACERSLWSLSDCFRSLPCKGSWTMARLMQTHPRHSISRGRVLVWRAIFCCCFYKCTYHHTVPTTRWLYFSGSLRQSSPRYFEQKTQTSDDVKNKNKIITFVDRVDSGDRGIISCSMLWSVNPHRGLTQKRNVPFSFTFRGVTIQHSKWWTESWNEKKKKLEKM